MKWITTNIKDLKVGELYRDVHFEHVMVFIRHHYFEGSKGYIFYSLKNGKIYKLSKSMMDFKYLELLYK